MVSMDSNVMIKAAKTDSFVSKGHLVAGKISLPDEDHFQANVEF